MDGDGMGRAFPEIPMVSFSLEGVSASPMVCVDEKGNKALFNAIDNAWVETLSRTVTIAMGLLSYTGSYAIKGETLKRSAVRGTISLCIQIGKAIIDGLFKTTNSLGKASAANYIAAWANPVLISGLFERFGMLPPRFNRGYHDSISKLTGITAAGSIVDVLFGKDGSFPSNIDFGSEGGDLVGKALMAEGGGAAAAGAGAAPVVL